MAYLSTLVLITNAAALPGDLDTSFGDLGRHVIDFGANDRAYGLALQADGRIVAAGQACKAFGVVRLDQSGHLDTTFLGTGRYDFCQSIDPRSNETLRAKAVAVEPDGTVLLSVGSSRGSSSFSLYNILPGPSAVWRTSQAIYNLQKGSDNSANTRIPNDLNAMQYLADGRLAGTGYWGRNKARDFLTLRNTGNGLDTDTSFNHRGYRIADLGGDDVGNAVIVDKNNNTIVAGKSNAKGSYDLALARFLPNGKLDPGFGAHGVVFTDIAGGNDEAHALVQQADGKLVVAGFATIHGTHHFALARYNTDGSLDTSFGKKGLAIPRKNGAREEAYALAMQADGQLLIAGRSNARGTDDFALMRLRANGRRDPSFGSNGLVLTDLGGEDSIRAIALQADGKLVVSGYTDAAGTNDFAIARYETAL